MASFSNYCNICYKIDNENLKDISEENVKHFKDILIAFVGHADIIKHNEIYLCQLCRETLTRFDSFRKMCLSNLIEMRPLYINMKMGIEDDTNIDSESDASSIEDMKEEYGFITTERQNSDSELNVKQENNVSVYLDLETNEDEIAFQIANVSTIVNMEYCKPVNNSSENAKPGMKLRNRSSTNVDGSIGDIENNTFAGKEDNETTCNRRQADVQRKRPHWCQHCHKQFPTSSKLIRHVRTHTGDKPYKCTVCDKAFTQPGALHRHARTHTNERPYKCNVCEKSFIHNFTLTTHQLTHTNTRPYKCTHCSQAFTDSSNLTKHMRIHTGQRPYKCSVCDKAFTHSGNLTIHMRVHSGQRPYKCTVCDKTFTHSGHLTSHMRVHSGQRPYKCTVCDKSFTQSSNLTAHKRTHGNTLTKPTR